MARLQSVLFVCAGLLLWLGSQACVSPVDQEKVQREKTADGGVNDGIADGVADGVVSDGIADGVVSDGVVSDEAGELKWYTTCGDPACGGHRPQQGVSACTSQKEGTTCTSEGEKCDPINSCNQLFLCSKTDPKKQVGGCPISTRRLKRDIRYLETHEQEAIYRTLMGFRLATYRYTFDPSKSKKHLGFILEDQPESPAVDAKRSMVDLYQYTSMVVASMQAQARAFASQRQVMEAQTRAVEAQKQVMEAQSRAVEAQKRLVEAQAKEIQRLRQEIQSIRSMMREPSLSKKLQK